MKTVIFFMEDNQKSFFSDVNVWRDTTFAFDLDCYIIVDETTEKQFANWFDQYKESHVVNTIEEGLRIHPESKKVLLSPHGKISIKDFTHPLENVIYIVGPDSRSISISADYEVKIDAKKELWAIQAYSIALYDRSTKI